MIKTRPALLCGVALLMVAGGTSRARAADACDGKAEWRLVQLINEVRADYGLAPLREDARLKAVARSHTKLMVSENTLSHQLPGENVFGKRLQLSGVYFYAAGETAAFNSTADAAQESFLHSPPHRRIILDPRYDAVGIGVVARDGMVWVTEDFAHLQTE